MKTLDDKIALIVKDLKKRDMLKDVVFIRAFPPERLPNPVEDIFASVTVSEVSSESLVANRRAYVTDATLRIRLYSPIDEKESRLSVCSAEVFDVLRNEEADTVTSVTVSAVKYETQARAIYRDILADLRYISEVCDG